MRIARRLLSFLFFCVGVGQLAWCISESRQALASKDWPIVTGMITSAQIVDGPGRGTSYIPTVRYSYTVDGVSYTGNRIYFRDVSELPNQARMTIQRFPVQAEVAVHYRRERPAESVLRPGLYWYSYAWLGLSLMGIVVGGAGLFLPRGKTVVLSVA